jgi:hypothetical protein
MHPLSLHPGGPVYNSTGAEGTVATRATSHKSQNPFFFATWEKVFAADASRTYTHKLELL